MIVAVSIGTFVKLVVALVVAVWVIVLLLAGGSTQEAPGPSDVPPSVDVRADR